MRETLRYWLQVLKIAFPRAGELVGWGHPARWPISIAATGLTAWIAYVAMGPTDAFQSRMAFIIYAFAVAGVLFSLILIFMMAATPPKLAREASEASAAQISDVRAELASVSGELRTIKDYDRKALIPCEVCKSAMARLNSPPSNKDEAIVWCQEHLKWFELSRRRVEQEVSPADAHRIFDIGDINKVPPEKFEISPDHGQKTRWLRHYINRLQEVTDEYRDAARRA
jgi:hypothetical protein